MALGERFRDAALGGDFGYQALEVIRALTREHEQVLTLASDVRAARLAGDTVRQVELAGQIVGLLARHAQVEEQGLFPALAADYPDQVALLQAEHRLIAAALADAMRAASVSAASVSAASVSAAPAGLAPWPDRLARALALLREHIFKEQDGIFPAALATLRAADWDAVDAVRVAAPAPLVPGPRPALPVTMLPGVTMVALAGPLPGIVR